MIDAEIGSVWECASDFVEKQMLLQKVSKIDFIPQHRNVL